MVLAAEPDVEAVDATADARGLTKIFAEHPAGVVVLELDAPDWDACRLAAALRKRRRSLIVVGVVRSCDRVLATRAKQAGVRSIITRDGGLGSLLRAIRTPHDHPTVVTIDFAPAPSAGIGLGAASPTGLHPVGSVAGRVPSLTPRQLDVLLLVGAGLTTREIGERLHISPKTVENHKQRIFERLGVNNQAHAVAVAMRAGLVDHTPSASARNAS